MKFTKISSLRGYRIFRNFTWDAALPELGRYNVFYGWNGSGKTTLSSVFEALEQKRSPDATSVSLAFDAGSIQGVDFPSDNPRPAVKVFNRSYVETTVFRSGMPGLPPIFYVAEGGTEKKARLDAIAIELRGADGKGGMEGELTTAERAASTAEQALETFKAAKAAEIKAELRSSGEQIYNNYDKRNYKERAEALAKDANAVAAAHLDDRELQEQRKRRDAVLLEKIDVPDLLNLEMNALDVMVGSVLSKTVVSEVIDALAEDPSAESWVRQGMPIHGLYEDGEAAQNCKFCDQSLPQDRIAKLEAHFNDNYQKLVTEIGSVEAHLNSVAKQLANPNLPKGNEISNHLRPRFSESRDNLETIYADQRARVYWLQEAMSAKKGSPFASLNLDGFIKEANRGMDSPLAYIEELRNLVEEHNDCVDRFEDVVHQARIRIENSMLASSLDEYASLLAAPDAARARADDLKGRRSVLLAERRDIELSIDESSMPAQELNEELRSYLGRDELSFSVSGSGYLIQRSGIHATDLSEGERTAIAFLYFLKSLSGTSFDLAKGVVVIDDPVSSLDANSLFCSFAYMKRKTAGAAQLLVFTHNFLFLRQIKDWFRYVETESRQYMVQSYMEEAERSSRIVKMDKLIRDHQSEYHYLYRQVKLAGAMDQGKPLETYYGHPNMARRLLEIFLGFRYPAKKSFHARLDALNSDAATLTRIRRFVHSYSHEEGDGNEFDATMLAESPTIMASVIAVIAETDPIHSEEMETLCRRADQADAA